MLLGGVEFVGGVEGVLDGGVDGEVGDDDGGAVDGDPPPAGGAACAALRLAAPRATASTS